MQTIADPDTLEQMKTSGALFILFGGAHCAVCHSLRPQLAVMLARHFPDMRQVYIDCEAAPAICAQHRVFSLPVVQAYIEGKIIVQAAGAFALHPLLQELARPYAIWHAGS